MDRRRVHRSVGAVAILTVIIALAGAAGLGPISSRQAQAAGPLTVLVIDGDAGDMVSQGKQFVLYGTDATYVSATTRMEENGVSMGFGVPGGGAAGDYPWAVELYTRSWWEKLTVGSYPDAVGSWDGERPVIAISGNGFLGGWREGCYEHTGSFTIHELSMSWPEVYSLSASFEQTCAETPGETLYGEIRYNAAGDFKAADVTPFTVDFGQADNGTGTATREVTVKSIGTLPVELRTADIVGPAASVFTIESNACTGVTLQPRESCTLGVSARPNTNGILRARLRVADDTTRGRREAILQVEGLGEVDGSAAISPITFFPVVDDYLDMLEITGTRAEDASVDVHIASVATGTTVFDHSIEVTTGAYRIIWNGRADTGGLVEPGEYDVTATLTDRTANTRVVAQRVTVSHDWISWTTRRVARQPWKFSLWGWSRGGRITLAKSSSRFWVRLASNRGFAAVIYEFPVASAKFYQPLTFEVLGRSPNLHKAVIAIWNPRLGGFKTLDSYDAARKIGPREEWWRTEAPAAGRRRNGVARAAVMVWKGLGGPGGSTFEVGQVRLVYATGTYQAATQSVVGAGDAAAMRITRTRRVTGRTLASLTGEMELPGLEAFVGWLPDTSLEVPVPVARDGRRDVGKAPPRGAPVPLWPAPPGSPPTEPTEPSPTEPGPEEPT
jgi:hypothetical protein